ncbi:MAG: response regulator transcription factor [Myxococcota bacterium]|nr:response regulator transcription factor [Myxococcota bacterium]
MDTIRVMIADDHAILRAGLRSLLALQEDMELIAEAIDGQDAVNKAEQNKPDVLLMDITMPGMNGIEALKHVRKVSPGSRVLILTMHDDHAYLRSVLAAGGSGYLVKRAADTELLAAIRTVHQGRSYIDVGLENNQLQAVLDNDEQEASDAGGRSLDTLSERERQVLELVALGYTHKEVGEELSVSVKTVETYRSRLSEKLGLRSRAELVKFALDRGLLDTSRASS